MFAGAAAGLVVLRTLSAAKGEPVYGLDLARRTGLAASSLYSALDSLERDGLIQGVWADTARPRRRGYRLTAQGEVAVRAGDQL